MTKTQRKNFVRQCKAVAEQYYPKLHWRTYEHKGSFNLEGSFKPYDGRFESYLNFSLMEDGTTRIRYRDERGCRHRKLRYLTVYCFETTLHNVCHVIYRGVNRERNDYFTAATKRMEAFRATT